MLAERRQKMKWSTNPCGNLWTKDSNKFGQKILEKFGWTPGKGLGVSEQGIVNPVRLKCNSTQKGLGYDRKNSTVIFQHQEEFDSILSGLNTSDVAKSTKDAPRSLEEKSKQCKTRVHYHKFTRGKDLSRYSEKDLSCILGAVSSHKEKVACDETVTENFSTFSSSEIRSVSLVGEEPPEDQTNDLFLIKNRKKRKFKRKKELLSENHDTCTDCLIPENECKNHRVDFKSDGTNCEVDEEPISNKKRRKKDKKLTEEITEYENFSNNYDNCLEMSEDVVNKKKKKLKKKHKKFNKGE